VHRINPTAYHSDIRAARLGITIDYTSPSTKRTPTALPSIPQGGANKRFKGRLMASTQAWQDWVAVNGRNEMARQEPYAPKYFTGRDMGLIGLLPVCSWLRVMLNHSYAVALNVA
jgi:hypothetical protein